MREADFSDLPEITRMGESFCVALGEVYEPESIIETATNMIESEASVILLDEHSMAGAVVMPYFINHDRLIATELFWWVDEDARGNGAGIKLLNGLESWAKAQGADRLSMMSMDVLDGKKIGKLYQLKGYQPSEQTYTKDL